MWVESHSQEVAVLSPVGTGSGDSEGDGEGDGIQLRIRKRHEPPWMGTTGFIEFFVIGGVQAGVGFSISRGSEGFLVAQLVKNLPAMRETWVRSLGWEDLLENGKATHSSLLAWRMPWTVQSMGSQRVGHD